VRVLAMDTDLWEDNLGRRLHAGRVRSLPSDEQSLGPRRLRRLWLL